MIDDNLTKETGKSKRPSFQFYPSDWLTDIALRSCSIQARGLWIDMICHMHQGSPYGYLKVNHKVIHAPNLARMVGLTAEEVEGCIQELLDAGVCQVDDEGCFYSKRMIRDENLRQIRAAGGKKGGNPALMDKQNLEVRLTSEDKQNPTPSSSSSSSSSVKKKKTTSSQKKATPLDPSFEFPAEWKEKAIAKGMTGSTAELQFEKFKTYHLEHATESPQWAGRWATWCLTWVERGSKQVGSTWIDDRKSKEDREYDEFMEEAVARHRAEWGDAA